MSEKGIPQRMSGNEAVAEAEESDVERMHQRQNMSFIEFLREFSNKKQ